MFTMALKLVPRGLTAREQWLFIGSLVVAILLLLAALIVPMVMGWAPAEVPSWWAWFDAVLINVGAAIALLAPIEWISSRLRRSVEESEDRQERRVQEVRDESASRLADFSERLDSLERLRQRVAQRFDDAVAADHAMFGSVATEDAAGVNAIRALTRAKQRGLISGRGVRVPYNEEGGLDLWFQSGTKIDVQIPLVVTDESGQRLANMSWPKTTTAEEMIVQLATVVRSKGRDALPSPDTILNGLADTLVHADRYEFARPIIQYFPPQWALTDTAIVASVPGFAEGWTIEHTRTDRGLMYRQAHDKEWLDAESFEAARAAAEKLVPLNDLQRAQRS